MTKANKKSFEAKAYINGKVNDMREKLKKTPDNEARKQLADTFRETTSSDEYQEKLDIVNEDVSNIRKNAKMKKWWDITPEEFKKAKAEFYGKDMDLHFWEDFEKLNFSEKVDYIFEKFWDTDYAADLIIDLTENRLIDVDKNFYWYTIKGIIEDLNDWKKFKVNYPTPKEYYGALSEKFWTGAVTVRLYFYFWGCLNRLQAWTHWGWFRDGLILTNNYNNITENTLKKIFKTKKFMEDWDMPRSIDSNPSYQPWLINIINWCEDWSISDAWLIKIFVDMFHPESLSKIMKKLSSEWQKYLIDYSIKTLKQTWHIHDWLWFDLVYRLYHIYDNSVNLWEGVDILECIINSMLDNLDDIDLEHFCEDDGKEFVLDSGYRFPYQNKFLSRIKDKHKQIVDIFIKAWKIELVKKYINNFTWLTEEEKSEILWM